jgi:hypothetical protein
VTPRKPKERRKGTATPKKKLKRPQAKGKAYERELCKEITAKLGGLADRVPCSGALPMMKGDLWCRGNVLAGYHIEAKRCESLQIPAWTRKAEEQAGRSHWLVVYRRSGERSRVVLDWDWFLNLLAMLQEGES